MPLQCKLSGTPERHQVDSAVCQILRRQIVPGMDPMGRKHYWFTVTPLEPADKGTDRWAVENDYVSITPLRLDLTNEVELKKIQELKSA